MREELAKRLITRASDELIRVIYTRLVRDRAPHLISGGAEEAERWEELVALARLEGVFNDEEASQLLDEMVGLLPQHTIGQLRLVAAMEHLWGIILAGGNGRRLQAFIRSQLGTDRPKQYCTFIGTRSMLRQTIARAERIIPPERLLTVVTRPHLPYAREELHDRPSDTLIVQPWNRETGPGILLPLLHVVRRDPAAVIVLLPSDHFIEEEERFMGAVQAAATFVGEHPERLILLGIAPTRPEVEYGWIEVGNVIGQGQGEALYQVRRFWEKPTHQLAQVLYGKGCLWNTLVLVGRAEGLLGLFRRFTPELVDAFDRIRETLGSSEEVAAVEAVYTRLPSINFSRAILTASEDCLGVLPVKGVHWSDWGDPKRVGLDLARLGAPLLRHRGGME